MLGRGSLSNRSCMRLVESLRPPAQGKQKLNICAEARKVVPRTKQPWHAMGSEPDLDALFGPGETAEAPQFENATYDSAMSACEKHHARKDLKLAT